MSSSWIYASLFLEFAMFTELLLDHSTYQTELMCCLNVGETNQVTNENMLQLVEMNTKDWCPL